MPLKRHCVLDLDLARPGRLFASLSRASSHTLSHGFTSRSSHTSLSRGLLPSVLLVSCPALFDWTRVVGWIITGTKRSGGRCHAMDCKNRRSQ
jgi:hypothetical protein